MRRRRRLSAKHGPPAESKIPLRRRRRTPDQKTKPMTAFERKGNSLPVFELFGHSSITVTPDVFGIWATAPIPEKAIAFDLGGEKDAGIPAEILLWRANLPANIDLAKTNLRDSMARLEASKKRLGDLPDRFDSLFNKTPEGSSFAVSATDSRITAAERELAQLSGKLDSDRDAMSFDQGALWSGAWQETVARFQAFVLEVHKTMMHSAWVETCIDEHCLARTCVGWFGDVETTWVKGLNTTQTELHLHTLELALTSRTELVHMLSIVIRVAALLAMPGNTLLVLPAVWKCINRLLVD